MAEKSIERQTNAEKQYSCKYFIYSTVPYSIKIVINHIQSFIKVTTFSIKCRT